MNNDEMLVLIKEMFENKVEEVKEIFNKKTEEVKETFNKKTEEVKNHTGVLVEKLEKDIKALAEGHGILDKKIDRNTEELKELKNEMRIVKDYVVGVDAKLNEHDIILKRAK